MNGSLDLPTFGDHVVGEPATPRIASVVRGLRRPLSRDTLLAEATVFQRLREYLYFLELGKAAENLADELERGVKGKLTTATVLENLLKAEVDATRERRLRNRIHLAQLPRGKTLENFDFDFQPSIDRQVIAELATLQFIEARRNVLLIGPPGVGKSHLAAALGVVAVEAGYRAYFTTAADLVESMQRNHERGNLLKRQRDSYVGTPLLIIDELGYLSMDQAAANWLFHVVSRRYERASVILTSNRGFGDWSQIFLDTVVASAIVDRLLHNATVINIRGQSYRMRKYQPMLSANGPGGGAMVR